MQLKKFSLGDPKKRRKPIDTLSKLNRLYHCPTGNVKPLPIRKGLFQPALSAVKDEKFPDGIIDHHGRDNIGRKGIGGEYAKPFDQQAHNQGTNEHAQARHAVKQKDFDDEPMFARLKDPKHIEDIGHQVGNHKGQDIADHRISGPVFFLDRAQLQPQEPDQVILPLQGREQFPGGQVEHRNVGDGGQAADQPILDELYEVF
jgi:hypothetical protein